MQQTTGAALRRSTTERRQSFASCRSYSAPSSSPSPFNPRISSRRLRKEEDLRAATAAFAKEWGTSHTLAGARKQARKLIKRVASTVCMVSGSGSGNVLNAKDIAELAELFASGGEGLAKDQGVAARLHLEAAEMGFARSQCAVGMFLVRGQGMDKDEAKGREWIQKAVNGGIVEAADGGHAAAQSSVGYLHGKGLVLEKSQERELHYYTRSASGGCAQGMSRLAYLFREGKPKAAVEKDLETAAHWYVRKREGCGAVRCGAVRCGVRAVAVAVAGAGAGGRGRDQHNTQHTP